MQTTLSPIGLRLQLGSVPTRRPNTTFSGSRVVAKRVRELLASGTRSVGIVGPFGIGKTSIVEWIVETAEDDSPKGMPSLLFSQHSCWGFETSASAIHTILTQGVEKIARCIDTFRVKSLPESYRQMFSAGGQWLDNVSKLFFRPGDPIQQFRGLSDLLQRDEVAAGYRCGGLGSK